MTLRAVWELVPLSSSLLGDKMEVIDYEVSASCVGIVATILTYIVTMIVHGALDVNRMRRLQAIYSGN